MTEQQATNSKPEPNNAKVAFTCLAFAGGMLGMAYAAVPLYKLFCQVTGFGGTTQRVEQVADRVVDRMITVRFDANVTDELNWTFKPKLRSVKMKMGESTTIDYVSQNVGQALNSGSATFNVTPQNAGAYFNKLECFCFTKTDLKPGESLDMAVMFYIDPDMADDPDLKNVNTITLSYTMLVAPEDAEPNPNQKPPLANKTAAFEPKEAQNSAEKL